MVSTGGKIVITVLFILFLACAGWIVFTQLRARRLGLPSPTLSSYFQNPFSTPSSSSSYSAPRPAPGGIVGWVNDRIRGFQNRSHSSGGGAYAEPLAGNPRGRGTNRGFGPLDPDDAWDARVGTEADTYGPGSYYEEQELGLHTDTGYGGSHLAPTPGQAPAGFGEARGRSKSREVEAASAKKGDHRYDEEMGLKAGKASSNPFGDDAEASNVSLRGVSPRPTDGGTGGKHDGGESPTERRSMFRENM